MFASLRHSGLAIFFVVSLQIFATAQARNVRQVHDGTAYTLEKGEFSIGIFSPVQYGLTDEVTVVTHPVLHLLLTPNLVLRGKVLDSTLALSINAGYIQTFLDPKRLNFPGTFSFYPMATVPFSNSIALSWHVGYLLDMAPIAHGIMFGGGLTFLLSGADLLNLQAQDEYYWDTERFRVPTILFTYSHYFYRLQVRVGVAFGRFPIQVGNAATDVRNLPAYPVLDLVWVL